MKALILSCNTGQGHNAAGRAVTDNLKQRGIDCEMRDALAFAGEKTSRIASGCYVGITTHSPRTFRFLYAAGKHISRPDKKSVVYWANELYADHMRDYIVENGFDTIIMPHLFPAQTLTSLRDKTGLNVRCYAIATDYTCVPFWEETAMDAYFIPHPDLTEEFAAHGIPREKLIPLGIPVHSRFLKRRDKAEARIRLGLPAEGKLFLFMTGSMGFGDLETLLVPLLRRCTGNEQVLVLGGNNRKMKTHLRERFADCPQLQVLDFTTRVDEYMDACDLLFTKPGGLTSTEAAVKNVPLVHTAPIPGCETVNAAFFSQRGLSLTDPDPEMLIARAWELAQDEDAQARMREHQRNTIFASACDDICDYILRKAEVVSTL